MNWNLPTHRLSGWLSELEETLAKKGEINIATAGRQQPEVSEKLVRISNAVVQLVDQAAQQELWRILKRNYSPIPTIILFHIWSSLATGNVKREAGTMLILRLQEFGFWLPPIPSTGAESVGRSEE